MKKIVTVLIISGFLLSSGSVTSAGHYHRYHCGYYGHSGHYWAAWGVGLLTGTFLSTLLYPPPPRVVVYRQPAPVVVYRQPAPVVVYSAPAAVPQRFFTPPSSAVKYDKVLVGVGALNVRSGPGWNHPVSAVVSQGQVLDVLGASPGWFYVRTPSGVNGWVMIKYTIGQASPVG